MDNSSITLTNTGVSLNLPETEAWIFPDNQYTAGDMDTAFYVGKAIGGMEDTEKLEKNLIDRNKNHAALHTYQILDFMRKQDLHPSSARLHVIDKKNLEVFITLPNAEFNGESFDQVLYFALALETNNNNELYDIHFRFFHDDGIIVNKLYADGFFWEHAYFLKR